MTLTCCTTVRDRRTKFQLCVCFATPL